MDIYDWENEPFVPRDDLWEGFETMDDDIYIDQGILILPPDVCQHDGERMIWDIDYNPESGIIDSTSVCVIQGCGQIVRSGITRYESEE